MSDAELRVEPLAVPALDSAEAAHWDRLLCRSASNSLFLTTDWIALWLEAFSDYQPLILGAFRAGQSTPCAIAPLMIGHRLAGTVRQLMFIGQGEATYPEFLDLIVEPGLERSAAAAFVDTLMRPPLSERWDLAKFSCVLEGSPNLAPLREAWSKRAGALAITARQPAFYAPLPGGWENYRATMSRVSRKRVMRRQRKLEALGKVTIERAGHELPLEQALDLLITLNQQRWGDEGRSFRDQRYTQLHQRFSARALAQDRLQLLILKLDGKPLAATYGFYYDDKLWDCQGGWDPAYAELSVAAILTAEAIRMTAERGGREHDFGAGETEDKRRWAKAQRLVVDLRGFSCSRRGRAVSQLIAARDRLAPLQQRVAQRIADWRGSRFGAAPLDPVDDSE